MRVCACVCERVCVSLHAREALSGCSSGSGVGGAGGGGGGGGGGGEKRRGTLGKTPLRRVTPGPLFLWPIYRLLLLALCYYCYQVLFAPRRSPPPPPPSPLSPNRLQCRAFYCSPTMCVEHSIGSTLPHCTPRGWLSIRPGFMAAYSAL